MSNPPSLHELLAHSHLLTERQRRQGSIGAVGPLLCVHVEGVRDGTPVTRDRFFADQCSPAAALLALRNYSPEREHELFVVDAPRERQRAFVRVGFRLLRVEWLMALALRESPGWPAPDRPVTPATTASQSLLLDAIDGLDPIPAAEITDPALAHFYAQAEGRPVAYGRSARYDETTAWVSHVYTAPAYRRQGYATAVMAALLAHSAATGVGQSLLLATEMAYGLYERLRYRTLAPVAVFRLPTAALRRH